MATTVTYKGQVLVTVDNSTKVLETSGTWCEDDFTLVDVSGGGSGEWTTEGIAKATEPNGVIVLGSSVTSLVNSPFRGTPITSFTADYVTSNIPNDYLSGCTSLASISMANLNRTSGNYWFSGCSDLTNVNLPKQTVVRDNIFRGCTSLAFIDMPACTTISTNGFYGCTNLATIVLRNTTVVALTNVNAFQNTRYASGGGGGDVYIPETLYYHLGDGTALDYQSASNWITLYNAGTVTFKKIEGSIYE